MKKNTRAHTEQPERGRGRVLQLSQETVRVLSPTHLAHAAGGSGCTTTSYTTERTRTDGSAGVAG
jgi:hypothetical protein